jgi:hypothetical protein
MKQMASPMCTSKIQTQFATNVKFNHVETCQVQSKTNMEFKGKFNITSSAYLEEHVNTSFKVYIVHLQSVYNKYSPSLYIKHTIWSIFDTEFN